MTKIAQLHDGSQIHFPDETPDHEIDAGVQRFLGATPQMSQHKADKQDEYGLHAVTAAHQIANVQTVGKQIVMSISALAASMEKYAQAVLLLQQNQQK